MEKDEYAIYLRKSREDIEAEKHGEGETLAKHRNLLLELAKRCNYKIGEIYEEIVSGETIESRNEMQKLLRDLEVKRWKGVLVVELERLTRGEPSEQGIVEKCFWYSKTLIITPYKTYDPDNPLDQVYFRMGLFMSNMEYETIKRRLRQGRVAAVKQGKYVGSIAPYGYDKHKLLNDKGFSLSINTIEAEVVKKIFIMYVYEGLSLNAIAKELNSQNLKPRNSRKWSISTIKDLINNPVYIGKIRWNARREIKSFKNGREIKSRPRNSDILICDGLHQPIISQEVWELAQKKRKLNKAPVEHNDVIQNSLAGIVVCAKCGKNMQRRPYKKAGLEPTLICTNPECDNISSKFDIVENQLLEALRSWKSEFFRINNAKKKQIKSSIVNTEGLITKIDSEIKKLKSKLEKVYDCYEDGSYDKETFTERSEKIKKQIKVEESNKEDLELRLENELVLKNSRDKILTEIDNVLDLYYKLTTAEEKNLLLKSILDKVTYLKIEKSVKKDSDPTNFELGIYPKIPKEFM